MRLVIPLLKVLPLGVVFPLVIAASAAVSPDDAASNLSKWAKLFGAGHVPAWLSSPSIDHRVVYGGSGFAVAYVLLVWIVPRVRLRGLRTPTVLAATSIAKLEIVIRQRGKYDQASFTVIGTINRTASIGIKNAGSVILSNCKVYCEIRDQDAKVTRWFLADLGGLQAGEERRLGIASYTEPNAEGHTGLPYITLHAPPANCYDGFYPRLPAEGGALWITAISDETPPCEAICRLWVDGRLKWRQV